MGECRKKKDLPRVDVSPGERSDFLKNAGEAGLNSGNDTRGHGKGLRTVLQMGHAFGWQAATAIEQFSEQLCVGFPQHHVRIATVGSEMLPDFPCC